MRNTPTLVFGHFSIPTPARLSFLRPAVFAACALAWLVLACFIWAKDFLLVGTAAPGLAPTEVLLTVQSMVLWGAFSPFILTAAQLFEFEPGRRMRAFAAHLGCALLLAAIDVACDLLIALFTHLENSTFSHLYYREIFINVFSYTVVAAIGYALVYYHRLSASHVASLELQRELAVARLDALARTFQPHFLFNALNTVAALVRLKEERRA